MRGLLSARTLTRLCGLPARPPVYVRRSVRARTAHDQALVHHLALSSGEAELAGIVDSAAE
eukprot:15356730-Alexandrium_andersonii.AAC.1